MKNTHPQYIFGLLLLVAGLLFATPAHAFAEPYIYFTSATKSVPVGGEVTLHLLVDSEKTINAMEIDLAYPATIIKPTLFNDGKSILGIWQTREWKAANGHVIVSGGTPEAFSGIKGEIVSITFKALKEGVAKVSFAKNNVYYADGKGTRAVVSVEPITITVTPAASASVSTTTTQEMLAAGDTEPPLFEFGQPVRNPSKGNYIAIFQVSDPGSGIEGVSMRTKRYFSWSKWYPVANPVEITSGIWKYELSAKDNSGNETNKTFTIYREMWKKLSIVILLLVFLVGVLYFIMKR